MSETTSLVAEVRERGGKGAARATRREDKIPAVIYGGKEEPLMVALDRNALTLTVNKGSFTSKLCTLEIKGKQHQVLPRDVQIHPVTDAPIHVDFLRVTAGTQISVMVPMVFTDHEASPGLKKGGVLNVVRHEVEFICRADSIPEKFTKSLAGLEIGDSIHISHIDLPEGVHPAIRNRDFTIATIAPPTTQEEVARPVAAAEAAPAAGAAVAAPGAAPGAAKAAPGAAKKAEPAKK